MAEGDFGCVKGPLSRSVSFLVPPQFQELFEGTGLTLIDPKQLAPHLAFKGVAEAQAALLRSYSKISLRPGVSNNLNK